jgi:hypothetical protein
MEVNPNHNGAATQEIESNTELTKAEVGTGDAAPISALLNFEEVNHP